MNSDDLDVEFKQGLVSRRALDTLIEAEASNSATSIGWLEERLYQLECAVARRPVQIEAAEASRTLNSTAEFIAWCRSIFPNACGIPLSQRPEQQVAAWVDENLIDGGKFSFDSLGEALALDFIPSGELPPVLSHLCMGESVAWISCAENPGNGVARVLQVQLFGESGAQAQMFSRFEKTGPRSHEGKANLQLLLPRSRCWLLVSRQESDAERMTLHGGRATLDAVRHQIGQAGS